MKTTLFSVMAMGVFAAANLGATAVVINLGAADSFAVLASSTITNIGGSSIFGSLGLSPGSSITGFPPGKVTGGGIHISDTLASMAQTDLSMAYTNAAGQVCGTDLTGQSLGGLVLFAGVYCFSSSAQLTGQLTLDAQGNPNSVFLFQIGSALNTANNSAVVFTNGGQGNNLFWQVGSSATLGTATAFQGNILAAASITLNTNATIPCGRALALNGAVTMDTNAISINTAGCETIGGSGVPEPSTASLFLLAGVTFLIFRSWTSRRRACLPAARCPYMVIL